MVFRNERTWQNAVEAGKEEEFHQAYEAAVEKIQQEFGKKHSMFIGGKAVWARDTFEDLCPWDTRKVLGIFQKGTRSHAKQAIAAARKAFPDWSSTDYTERAAIFRRAADLVSERKFHLSALMSFENGKNRYEAFADVDEMGDLIRWYAEELERNRGYSYEMGKFLPGERTRSVLKPYGVWSVVAPFNFPAAIAAGMSAGAVITGNTAVFKPASDTPFMGLRIYEVFRDAGVPPGAFHFVTGPGSTIGRETS